jgi:hypothetical protein
MNQTIIRGRRRAGFSLIDPLVGVLAFAAVIVGVMNFWRLAEYKCDRARIDSRVSQILRESTDYITYAAYDLLPADGEAFRSGFLLHPLDPATGTYKAIFPFSVGHGRYHGKCRDPGRAKADCSNPHLHYQSEPCCHEPPAGDHSHQCSHPV